VTDTTAISPLAEGRSSIRIERSLRFPAERVWRALADPVEIERWFVGPVTWTPAVGETYEVAEMPVRVTEVDQPHVLAWEWGPERYRYELEPDEGGCRLTFIHEVGSEMGPPQQFAAGWDIYLGRLHAHLHGAYVDELEAHQQGVPLEIEGRPAVRFHRQLAHPVERVWRAVTTPEGLSAWFPATVSIDGELRPGTAMHFEFAAGFARDGEVLTVESERLLEFAWGDDHIRIDLVGVPAEPPLTILTFMHTLSNVPDTLARTAAGWHVCLDTLALVAGGETPTSSHTGPTPEWRGRYDAYVERGFQSGAPIPETVA
jgi:uncharacterized protein YndB with AHSA1/START domain